MEIEHFYIEKGHGEPIILLHGNGENSSYFDAQIEAFSERYHVFAVDTRRHGVSWTYTKYKRHIYLVFPTVGI